MSTLISYEKHLRHSVGKEQYFTGGKEYPSENYERINESSITVKRKRFWVQSRAYFPLCPLCQSHLQERSRPQKVEHVTGRGPGHSFDSSEEKSGQICTTCGWWYVQLQSHLDSDAEDVVRDDLTTYEGIISTFEPNEKWLFAMESLQQELRDFRKSLGEIPPGNPVEKLIGRILSQYHKCDVKHVGRVQDEGLDLILLRRDESIAVQVKHRDPERKGKSESVIPVREFVGVMVAEKYKKGLFVTTEMKYSSNATRYAAKVNHTEYAIELVDLVNIKDFLCLMQRRQWDEYDSLFS